MSASSLIPSPVARARCAGIGPLRTFAEAVAGLTGADDFSGCHAPFTDLVRSSFLSDLATWELERLRDDADHVPSGGGERMLEVLRLGPLNLSIRLSPTSDGPGPSVIKGLCEHTLLANAGPGTLELERWRQDAEDWQVLDRSRVLVPLPTAILTAGQVARLHAHRDVVRPRVVGQALAVVSLTRTQVTRLRWVYDTVTGAPIAAEAAESSTSRLEYAAALLAALGHQESAPVIATLYDHPDHFVRWAAVRQVTRLAPELGRSLVHRAVADPHPHVRRAAAVALQQLGEGA
jgi:hypothetical protein